MAFLKKLIDVAKNRPAAVLGFIGALLTLASAFGLHIMSGQSGAILAAVQAFLALLANASTVSKAKYNGLVAKIKAQAAK